MIVSAKWCPVCQRLRPVDAFTRDTSHADGLASRCRSCDAARSRRWYAANRHREIAAVRRHRMMLRAGD